MTDHHAETGTPSQSVLVGADGSEDGLRAVAFGARTARLFGATLHLVHAVDDAILAGAWGVVYDPGVLQRAGEEATQKAVAVAEEVGLPREQIHSEVVLGNASAVLSKLSEDAGCVVVGRRAMSGFERMFVGSTSVSVAATAKCPVIVISNASTPHETGGLGQIAVGIGSRAPGTDTLRFAFEDAQRRKAKLIVMNVQPALPAGLQPNSDQQTALGEGASKAVEAMLAPCRAEFGDVPVEVRIGFGHPADELVKISREVDLLVVGMRAPKILGWSVGGVTRAVMAHAESPLCIVK